MQELIMLIGLPGSGKTSWAKEYVETHPDYIVQSSDALREELYGDVNNNDHNGELFEELHRRIHRDLVKGKSVIYDATNLSKKRRIHFLSQIHCQKTGVLVLASIDQCKIRNSFRERKVPDETIDRMYRSFCPPHKSEGFDSIHYVGYVNSNIMQVIKETEGFDQENEHHQYSLLEHLEKTGEYCAKYGETLATAGAFHDIGKLYTKTRLNKKGIDDGNCHYYNHQNVGAYEFLLLSDRPQEESLYIANLIYYHMHPYLNWKQSLKSMQKDKSLLGEKMFQDILWLHEADLKSH